MSVVKPGPVASIEESLKRAGPRLKRVLASYRIPSEDAEDLLQQSLLALLHQREQVRDPESWLVGTLKRHCLMYWRKQRRRLYSAVDAALLEWLSAPVAPPQEREDLLSDLRSLLDRLPLRCRTVLGLRFQLGYEPAEVARRLGYREASIGKITTRCMAALARELLTSRPSNRQQPAAPDAAAVTPDAAPATPDAAPAASPGPAKE
jgi:RNA polymerase sigma factor (sigma-70 family)